MLNPNDIFVGERRGLITGSKVDVLFPKRSAEVGQRQYAKELANNMYWGYYDDNSTWQTEHGNDSESSAFEYFQMHYDKTAILQPGFISLENTWGGSADCICNEKGVDFKCPTSLQGWLDYLHEGISAQQYYQSQMYMFLHNKPEWWVCAFLLETNRMTHKNLSYPVPYAKRMICIKVQKEDGWEDKLRERSPKIIEMRNNFYKELISQFGEPTNNLNKQL